MSNYVLYNNDQPVAHFDYTQGMIRAYEPVRDGRSALLLRMASLAGFANAPLI